MSHAGGPPRRIIVLRHGQTTYNAAGIWQGQLDAPLSELGREQARDAAAALMGQGIDVIYASDLSRAADTARALGAACRLAPIFDTRLREINVGEWAGMTTAEVTAQYPDEQTAINDGEDLKRGLTGESVGDVVRRLKSFEQDVLDRLDVGATVALVTHGVTGRTLCAQLTEMPQGVAWRSVSGMMNCHWAEVVEHRTGWRIEKWNAHR